MDEIAVTRRGLMQAGGVSAAAAALPAGALPTGALAMTDYDPRKTSAGLVKLEAYADGRAAPWWYTGTIYAVRENTHPLALFRFEGCETYWASPKPTGEADMFMRTLTFYRDMDTGEWLDSYANPITGKTTELTPNMLAGHALYPADGSSPLMSVQKDVPAKPMGSYRWVVAGDMVLRIGDRAAPSPRQPAMEAQSTFCSAKAFFDPEVKLMGAQFSSTTFSPYLAWMGMGEEPGHLIWHASGLKLGGFSDLPPEYVARAEAIKPGALTAPPG